MYDSQNTTPVTLLTGFLGSGKTTLVNTLLDHPSFRNSALVINEFGDVSVDHDLVREGTETNVLVTNGCLCCTVSSDIRASLHALFEDRRQGRVPPFQRVIVETTGLADPAPIINSLIPGGAPALAMRDHIVARQFRLSEVICAVDSEHAGQALDTHFECWKQLAFADHIVLTKSDLADPSDIRERLSAINPTAQVHDRNGKDFDPAILAGGGSYAVSEKVEDVLGWLAMERLAPRIGHDASTTGSASSNRHGARIESLVLTDDEPLDPNAVQQFLSVMTSQPHAGLLRLKGILALADDPACPMVVHAVQHRLYPPVRLEYWPSIDVRSRLVTIGNGMPLDPIRQLFAALRPHKGWLRRIGL